MLKKVAFCLTLFIIAFSCSSEDDQSEEVNSIDPTESLISKNTTQSNESVTISFNREEMLAFWADSIIVPSYKKLTADLAILREQIIELNENATQEKLSVIREKWLLAYKTWQHVEMFNVGKAEEIYLLSHMNVYPVNEDRITTNINLGEYDLENPNNYATQGFPALDFMLYGIGVNDDEILEKYQVVDSNHYKYLIDLIDKMISKSTIVYEDWLTFRDEFVASSENTATSSINKLSNDFIYYFEKGLRANKFGIPAGVFSVNKLPNKVEGYYSRSFSKVLALESLDAVKNFFVGNAFENESLIGKSFQAYLSHLNTDANNVGLGDDILSKLALAVEKVNELSDSFVTQINNDNTAMLITYDSIQAVVVLLKVDMLQTLNINVDYADADGD